MSTESAARPAGSSWLRRIFDWRLWLGIAIPVVAVLYTIHDVDLAEVWAQIAGAKLWIVLLMMLVQVAGLWVRAVRWRWLALSLAPERLPLRPLFRATALAFMAINLLPFRIGELARPWLLARETQVRGSAALGTLVLERAIDFTCVSLAGGLVVFAHAKGMPSWVRSGSVIFALLTCVPVGLIAALRVNEAGTLALIGGLLRPFPPALRERALDITTEVCRGLAGLRGGQAIARVVLYSLLLWGVVLPAPFLLGLYAFDLDLSGQDVLIATFTANVFVALAVAAPSAPGFFGVFHFACREALALFGIARAPAVAYGTVVHLTYWLPVTVIGIVIAAGTGARMSELADAVLGKARSDAHR